MALIQSGSSTDLLKVDPTSNAARVTIYDPSGNLAAASHPSSKVIQNNATITAGGNALFTNLDSSAVALFINIEASPTGTSPTLTYTIAEVDPSDQATVVGQTITGSALNSINTQTLFLSQIKSNTILISWVLGGTNTPTFTQVNSVIVSQDGGNVTANIGNTNGLALDATLTGGTSKTQIYDGTNVIGTSAHPVRIDPTGTTTQPISGSVTANAGSGTFTIGGTVTANQGGTWTVQPGNIANTTPWLSTINQGGNSAIVSAGGALKVDGSAVTQPVSGTITANIGTTNGLALDTSVDGILLSQGSVTSGQKGNLIQGAVTTAAPSYTTAQTSPLSLTTSGALRTDASATTQPVSGTVTANAGSGTFTVGGTVTSNIGTTNGLALDATLTGGSAKTQMYDGTNTIGTSTHPVRTDPTGTTTQPVSGTITANAGSGTFTVSGTVTSNIGTTNGLALDTSVNGVLVSQGSITSGEKGPLIQGAVTTSAPSYTTAQTSPLSLTTAGALRTDGSAVTQPVSGTITANIGTTNGLALDATLTSGTAKIQIYDGTNVIGTSSHPVRTDPTGTTTQPVSGTITANAGSGTFAVSGTVTANIGTTNGLALDTSVNGILLSQGSTTSGQKGNLIQGAVTTAAPSYTTAQTSPLSLTTSGLLRVDGSAVTQPISGTITANAGSGTFTVSGTVTANQGGTWTVQPGNTANTTPWLTTINQGGNSATVTGSNALKVDGSAVTQPVSGTVTANIGTTNGLALDTSVNGLLVSQGSTTSGEKGTLIQGAVTTSAPSYTTAQTSPISLTTAGALRVDGSAVTQPVSGTVTSNIGTTNGLALDATVAKLTIAQSTSLGSNTQALVGGSVTTSAPTYTTGNINPLSLTTSGALRVDGSGATQPVSGTITANAGSGTFTVSGTVTSNQGTANSIGNSWPVEVTDGTNVLGVSAHPIRTDPTGTTTQPVSGTVTANQGGAPWSENITQFGGTNLSTGTGAGGAGIPRVTVSNDSNVLATQSGTWTVAQGAAAAASGAWTTKVTDGTNIAAVKAASTLPTVTDPAMVVSISPNSIAAPDHGAITAGTQQMALIGGMDGGAVARLARIGEFGTQRTTSEIMLWHDAIEGTTVNTFWTQATTTMTIAQTTGVLTLNNSGIATANTDAIITSQRQFPKYVRNPLYCRFRANISANAAANHTLVELGFGAPSGVTAVITTGAFFRWTAAGALNAVISFNGTEQSTQVLAQGTISTTKYYFYDIIADDDYVRFVVTDSSGVPVVDTQISVTNTVANILSVSHTPSFARVYADATGGGTVIKLNISAHSVQILDSMFNVSMAEQQAYMMRSSIINPTTYAQTANLANSTPVTETPSNTVGGYVNLGGEYAVALTVGSDNLLSVFAFTIPSPYSFVLRSITFSIPFIATANSVTGTPVMQWYVVANCATGNLSTGGGQRFSTGIGYNTASAAAAGTFWTNGTNPAKWLPNNPIVCLPGTVLHIAYKMVVLTAVATAGVTRGNVYVDGNFI